ncbi:unnamed protein product [Trifolium pratense]|uniref:Uncharacterized protein n=1 Tax=Trifolium pratense TaxID=57577 RepID=A0ACB0KZN3_TRIPR|nr:unnamed protein product [Trifolium pratense]
MRTKQTARRAPPFNQNRSPPRFCNPSPPPSSSLPLNLKPLRTLFPPYYDQPPPNPVQTPLNQNQTPPHLKPKSKKKPSFSAPPRQEDETDEEETDIPPSSKSYSNPSSDSSSEETKSDSSIPIQPQSEKGKEKVHETTSNKSKNRTQKEKSVNALSKDETPLFSSEAEESLFQEKWRTKPIAPGRFFNFEALKSHPLEIKAYTDFQGWSSFLSLKETYYPRLIQAFYFKANCDRENSTIRTKVKGVEFELNPNIIADIFKIPNNGFNAYGKNWYSLARTTFEEVRIPLFNLNASKNSRKTSNLNFLPKVFHIITQGSVLPRQGKYAELDDNEIMNAKEHCNLLNRLIMVMLKGLRYQENSSFWFIIGLIYQLAKMAVKSATKAEEGTKRWLSFMLRDCNRFCKIMVSIC